MVEHSTISFDSDSWPTIKKMLGLGKNLTCRYCGVWIMQNNVGGVSHPKGAFCKPTCCHAQHVVDWDAVHAKDANEVKHDQ